MLPEPLLNRTYGHLSELEKTYDWTVISSLVQDGTFELAALKLLFNKNYLLKQKELYTFCNPKKVPIERKSAYNELMSISVRKYEKCAAVIIFNEMRIATIFKKQFFWIFKRNIS